ncbi:hypothetical protein PABG_02937 [Paracoccidioides brasiliensis Pb03]|nr:hypothetical protein PABG_02937 [Paracoccidioides brasiliensis Pb03]
MTQNLSVKIEKHHISEMTLSVSAIVKLDVLTALAVDKEKVESSPSQSVSRALPDNIFEDRPLKDTHATVSDSFTHHLEPDTSSAHYPVTSLRLGKDILNFFSQVKQEEVEHQTCKKSLSDEKKQPKYNILWRQDPYHRIPVPAKYPHGQDHALYQSWRQEAARVRTIQYAAGLASVSAKLRANQCETCAAERTLPDRTPRITTGPDRARQDLSGGRLPLPSPDALLPQVTYQGCLTDGYTLLQKGPSCAYSLQQSISSTQSLIHLLFSTFCKIFCANSTLISVNMPGSLLDYVFNKALSKSIPVYITESGSGFKRLTGATDTQVRRNLALSETKAAFEGGKLFTDDNMNAMDQITIS